MNQRGINSRSNDIDRISQLPEFILHHIQSFLPIKHAARSCLISKPWLRAWSTRPFLDFDQPAFTSIDRQTFFELVNNTLAKYDQEGLRIQKFRLKIDVKEAFPVDKWLAIVLRNTVQELNLIIYGIAHPRYILPVFTSNSLTALELFRIRFLLNDTQFTRCPNLKKLILNYASVNDHTIQNLASICPLLEEFHVINCVGLRKICVAKLFNLKIFSCSLRFYFGKEVQVEAPKLQSFSCSYYTMRSNGLMSIVPYHNLRRFSVFRSTSITDTGLRNLLSQCPLLEELSLHSCFLFEKIHVASHSLKHLSLKFGFSPWSNTVVKVTVDAPNLSSLEYQDYKISYLSLVSPQEQAQAKSSIRAGYYENFDAKWFDKLGLLLKKFKTSDLTLCSSTPGTNEFIAVLPSLPVHEVDVLNLSVENKVSLPSRVLVSGLFSACHPKMIHLVWGDYQAEFIQCLCNELLWRRSLKYLGSDGVNCWWHYLEDAKLEILSRTKGKWIQLDRKRFLDAAINFEVGTEIRFTLKWCVAD